MQALEHWAEENGVTENFDSLCQNPKAKEYILGELAKIGKEKKVPVSFCWARSTLFLFGILFHLMPT